MKTTTGHPTIPLNYSSRESLLSANSELISQIQERLKAKRFRPQDGDRSRLAYARLFLQALQVQNSILKDLELEDLKQRVELLEGMQAGSPAEEQAYGSDLERPGPGCMEFEEQEELTEDTWSL